MNINLFIWDCRVASFPWEVPGGIIEGSGINEPYYVFQALIPSVGRIHLALSSQVFTPATLNKEPGDFLGDITTNVGDNTMSGNSVYTKIYSTSSSKHYAYRITHTNLVT